MLLALDSDKYDRWGIPVGGTYDPGDVLAALNTHRYEVFRYELHRIGSSGWELVDDITDMIHTASIKYDRWQSGAMRSADIELVDDPVFGTNINDLGDAIRCFRLMRMPDGNYAQWKRGTFYVPSPEIPLEELSKVTLHAPDSLRHLVDAKLDDWLTVPATADMATFWGHTDDLDDPVRWAISLIEHYTPFAGVFIEADPDEKRVPASDPLSYRPGDAVLDVVNDLLYYAGHDQLVANVDGSYISQPFVPPSVLDQDIGYIAGSPVTFPSAACLVVKKSWKWKRDSFEAFNKWTGIISTPETELAYTKELADPSNPLSTANRRVVHQVFYTKAPDAATLQKQVERKYEEGQFVLARLDGQVAAMPHDHRDKVALIWPTQAWGDLAGAQYIVKGWEEPMRAAAPMTLHLEQSPLTAFDEEGS